MRILIASKIERLYLHKWRAEDGSLVISTDWSDMFMYRYGALGTAALYHIRHKNRTFLKYPSYTVGTYFFAGKRDCWSEYVLYWLEGDLTRDEIAHKISIMIPF